MNRLAYLLSLICILAFSSCEEDKVYYHTAAKADFTIGENMYELGQTAVFKDASIPDEGSRIVAWLWEFGDAKKSVSTEQNPTFVYPSDGTFSILIHHCWLSMGGLIEMIILICLGKDVGYR